MAIFLHIGIRFYGLYNFSLLPVAPYKQIQPCCRLYLGAVSGGFPATSCVCALRIWRLTFLFIRPGHSNLPPQAVSHSSDTAQVQSSTAEELRLTDTAEKDAAVLQYK